MAKLNANYEAVYIIDPRKSEENTAALVEKFKALAENNDMVEKPTPEQVFSPYAILGRYVLKSDIFDILENQEPGYGGEIQLTDGLKKLAQKDRMVAVDFEGRRYDTGNLRGFLEATIDFALDHPETGDWLREFMRNKVQF